jgi:hypothetical protein
MISQICQANAPEKNTTVTAKKTTTKTLTGWWYTYPSEKYEFVSWHDYSQYMESHKTCSKPPTRYNPIK